MLGSDQWCVSVWYDGTDGAEAEKLTTDSSWQSQLLVCFHGDATCTVHTFNSLGNLILIAFYKKPRRPSLMQTKYFGPTRTVCQWLNWKQTLKFLISWAGYFPLRWPVSIIRPRKERTFSRWHCIPLNCFKKALKSQNIHLILTNPLHICIQYKNMIYLYIN